MGLRSKRKMKQNTKGKAIILLVILFVFTAVMLFRTVFIEEKVDKDIIRYEYSIEPNVTYQVHMKENNLYDSPVVDEGIYYFNKFIDFIEINFNLDYYGSIKVPINIEYQTAAVVSGYSVKENVKTVYYSKEFPIGEVKKENLTDMSFNINQTLKAGLSEYDTFIKDLETQTEFVTSCEVVFLLRGSILATTPYGEVNEPFEMNLTSPLKSEVITLTKGELKSIKSNLTEKVQEVLPVNIVFVALYGCIMLASLLGFLYLVFYTRNYDSTDEKINIIKKILNEHGSRIVALQYDALKSYQYQFSVNSIKDLVKVSDELQKPIFYELDEEHISKDFKFSVQNGEDIYTYCIQDPILE